MAVTGTVSCIGVKTVRACTDRTRAELVPELYTDNNSFWHVDKQKLTSAPLQCQSTVSVASSLAPCGCYLLRAYERRV